MSKTKRLNIDNSLPIIILPKEKTKTFIDWYKKDLYLEDHVPMVFNEGYFCVNLSDLIKIKTLSLLELNENTFTAQQAFICAVHEQYDRIIVHYTFIAENILKLEFYTDATKEMVGVINSFEITHAKSECLIANIRKAILGDKEDIKGIDEDLIIDIRGCSIGNVQKIWDEFGNKFSTCCAYLLISSFWYLASIKSDKERNVLKSNVSPLRNENVKHNNKKEHYNYIRNITTPIYDLGHTGVLNVEKLIVRKKGWKISYEFSVRGHYRHYKSGKVVFIKSFEKGKGLKTKQNIIRLNPS